MDYPVLVNRGKPLDLADLTQMPMKKKPRAPATRAGNRRKGGASGKSAPPAVSTAYMPATRSTDRRIAKPTNDSGPTPCARNAAASRLAAASSRA